MNKETIAIAGTLAAIAGVFWTYASFIAPRIKRYIERKIKHLEIEQAMRDVLLGRKAGEGNPITGESGAPALPGIAERLTNAVDSLEIKLTEISSEVKAANDARFKTLESNVKMMQHQINVLHKIIGVKAEAEKDLFPELIRSMNNESS